MTKHFIDTSSGRRICQPLQAQLFQLRTSASLKIIPYVAVSCNSVAGRGKIRKLQSGGCSRFHLGEMDRRVGLQMNMIVAAVSRNVASERSWSDFGPGCFGNELDLAPICRKRTFGMI